MKSKILSIIIILLLTGCTSNNEVIEITEHNKELEALKQFYEDGIQELNLSQEEEINNLNANLEKLELELEDVTGKYEETKRKYDLIDKAIFEENNKNESHYDDIYLEDKTIKVYSEGLDYLEDGIICILEAMDNNNNTIWSITWEGLQVSELVTFSPVTVADNRVYIVISGELNVIDINTGEIIWDSVIVGSSGNAPVVDTDGSIYTTGQYAPFLTAVSNEGNVKWQIESEDMYGIHDLSLYNDYLLVKQYNEIIIFDKEGNKLEQ